MDTEFITYYNNLYLIRRLWVIMENEYKKCVCCGNLEVPKGEDRLYYICNNCGWENDEIQNDKPNYSGGANKMSLNEAKKAYKKGKKVV